MIGMENDNKPVSQDNWGQIIRKDAKGCFVEVRNDTFHLDKVHLQFVSYDTTKPKGSRYVNNISIREARASRATPRRPELPRPHLRLRRSPARPCRHPRKCPRTSRGMRASAGDRTPSSRAEELETIMTTGVKERT